MIKVKSSSPLVVTLLGVACLHCGVSSESDDAPNLGGESVPGAAPPSTGGGTAAGGSGSNGEPPVTPPETEVEAAFLAPVVTGKYVFSANPSSGRVAVIDAENYGVRLFNAGFGPRFLSAIPGGQGAIVLNELSHDATLFRLDGDEVTIEGYPLPVHDGANAWAVSDDGRFALAWTRTPPTAKVDPTSGSQTVTVLDLERGASRRLTVGFHPTQVVIDQASTRAFVVNDDGISVIELGDAPVVTALSRVSADPLEEPATRDVSIPSDGSVALVRVQGSRELRIVDLTGDDGLTSLDLGSPIGDLDLSLDGRLAVAALPATAEVVLVPVPPSGSADSFERIAVPGEVPASVSLSAGAELALLYQNGAPNSHLTVLDLREGEERAHFTLDLKGPVSAAFAAPGARTAIALQSPIAGSRKPGLFSGLPTLERRSAKIIGADAPPTALAFDESGEYALVTVGDEKSSVHGVYRVRLGTLQEDFVPLASTPLAGATGVVEQAGRGFVAQAHPEGRITFIELETARARTITGFELAARILQ
jgi:hypothetical protein